MSKMRYQVNFMQYVRGMGPGDHNAGWHGNHRRFATLKKAKEFAEQVDGRITDLQAPKLEPVSTNVIDLAPICDTLHVLSGDQVMVYACNTYTGDDI